MQTQFIQQASKGNPMLIQKRKPGQSLFVEINEQLVEIVYFHTLHDGAARISVIEPEGAIVYAPEDGEKMPERLKKLLKIRKDAAEK